MYCLRQMALLVCTISVLLMVVMGRPDSGYAPLPGPGLSYGGIPYGSMSGNVAEYFKTQAPPGRQVSNLNNYPSHNLNYKPIEQWL